MIFVVYTLRYIGADLPRYGQADWHRATDASFLGRPHDMQSVMKVLWHPEMGGPSECLWIVPGMLSFADFA